MKKIYHEDTNGHLAMISLSLISGGAVGNLIDRLFVIFGLFNYHGVIDFIDIGIPFYRFYIFNIADMCVSIGIILFIYYNYNQKNELNDYAEKI